jgi:hypothetical protein|tara:strand:+ start:857 stop:1000 length:144 start_codon:yes stop_codon:yes gene_type:complete
MKSVYFDFQNEGMKAMGEFITALTDNGIIWKSVNEITGITIIIVEGS